MTPVTTRSQDRRVRPIEVAPAFPQLLRTRRAEPACSPAPYPAPGCPAAAPSPLRPKGWAQREKGTAGRVLQTEWRLDDRGPSGPHPAAQRIRKPRRTRSRAEASLAFHTPAPTGSATSEGCRDASGKALGRGSKEGSLGAHCTGGPEDLRGDSVPVGAAKGAEKVPGGSACVLPVSPAAPEAPLLTARARNATSRRPRRAGAPPGPGTPAGGHARTRSAGHARPRVQAAGLARGAGRTDEVGGGGQEMPLIGEMHTDCPRGL